MSSRHQKHIPLEEFIKQELKKYGVNSNIYSFITRKLIETAILDLEGKISLTSGRDEASKRQPLEMLTTSFSKSLSKSLYQEFSPDKIAPLLNEASHWVQEVYKLASELFDFVFRFDVKTDSRLIVHTKNPYMPLEIGLAWHPLLNLPYIPSSTLKGVVRAFIRSHDRKELCGIDTEILLGKQDHKGLLIFFDAVPVKVDNTLLEPDVITPHYVELEGRIDETSVKPRPIVYPTVAKGVTFAMVMAMDSKPSKNPECILTDLPNTISMALSQGLGAKTSLGYGYVKVSLIEKKVTKA